MKIDFSERFIYGDIVQPDSTLLSIEHATTNHKVQGGFTVTTVDKSCIYAKILIEDVLRLFNHEEIGYDMQEEKFTGEKGKSFLTTFFPPMLKVAQSMPNMAYPKYAVIQVVPHVKQGGCHKGCGFGHNEQIKETIFAPLYNADCPRSIPQTSFPMSKEPHTIGDYSVTAEANLIEVPLEYTSQPRLQE